MQVSLTELSQKSNAYNTLKEKGWQILNALMKEFKTNRFNQTFKEAEFIEDLGFIRLYYLGRVFKIFIEVSDDELVSDNPIGNISVYAESTKKLTEDMKVFSWDFKTKGRIQSEFDVETFPVYFLFDFTKQVSNFFKETGYTIKITK